jgi:LAS superfamily LD-carboxypeptidase LdcB
MDNKIQGWCRIIVFGFFCLSCTNNTPAELKQQEPVAQIEEKIMEDYLTLDYLMGHFEPAKDTSFVKIKKIHADREGLYLRQEVYESFMKMYDAAKKVDIHLQIRSATRNFEYQKRLWEAKWNGKTLLDGKINAAKELADPAARARKILEFSSMPGTSRHHWGTDFDLNSFNNSWFESGKGKILFDWLTTHASDYGFYRPYTAIDKNRPSGYKEEKWHWSYVPVAKKLTTFAAANFENSFIKGFDGAETAEQIDILKHYILGVNSNCKE